MIDPTHPFASWFMWIVGASFLVVFALPLLVAPLGWARVFRWRIPEHTHLAVYLGRCLGATAVAVIMICFRAAPAPAEHAYVFELIIGIGVLMTAVHTWGAIRRVQPWPETAEIALYAGVTVVATSAYLGL